MRMREDEMRGCGCHDRSDVANEGRQVRVVRVWWVNFDAVHVTWIFPPLIKISLSESKRGEQQQ
jgi:hypothetical protein